MTTADPMSDCRPDVSVIIPTFNRLWCLPRAVASCRGNRCRVEIVVVDDGSTDGTADWLRQQGDIRVVVQSNQGQTWAINRGSQIAQGRYVRFLDSDDFLTPGAIDRQHVAAVETQADVVYSRVDSRDETTGKVESAPDTPLWDDFIATMLGEGYGSHFLGMLFRREFVAGIPRRPEFALREDRMFLLEVALAHPRIAAVPGCAGYWVRHGSQMHTSYRGLHTTVAAWQMWRLYERVLRDLEARRELTPRRARAAANVLWRVAHELARTHLTEAADLAAHIRLWDPTFTPPEPKVLQTMYRLLGYRWTQRLLRARRALRDRV